MIYLTYVWSQISEASNEQTLYNEYEIYLY